MKIINLELQTSNLGRQIGFYADKLGLPVIQRNHELVAFQAGRSELAFKRSPANWAGFYHLAFNIPENNFDETYLWLKERTSLILNKEWKDIFHFESWNAHAMYSYDPNGNILEFVARHNMDNANIESFEGIRVLSVSEIGIAMEDIKSLTRQLGTKAGLNVFHDTQHDDFVALGDDFGLVLLAKTGREWYPNTGKHAAFTPLKALIENNGNRFNLEVLHTTRLFQKIEQVNIEPVN